MRLKNLMENNQLDFNQPFLSVRRVSSMETSSNANETVRAENRWPPLPVYKSELKSGPLRNPGNIPFLWEHAPGRPKDGRKSRTIDSKSTSAAPKHSPRVLPDSKQEYCNSQGSTSSNSAHFPSHENMVKFKTLSERIERDLSDSEDEDETYLEANDTLSRSESFSMNCSVTGLSGFDDSDVKSTGTFSKDQQTRDLMMGRFLPAAKALASETPQVSLRKVSFQREQQRVAKKLVEMEKQQRRVNSLPPMLPSYFAPLNTHDYDEISVDGDMNVDESEYSSTKPCGLFARFCLRNSFCLLHPLPGMKTQGSSVASAQRVKNDNLTDSSCSSIKNLQNENKALDKNQMVELHEESTVRRCQSNRKSTSNDFKKQYKDLLFEGKAFPNDLERVKSSKVHNEPHGSGRTKFRELLANEPSSLSSFVVEKTLHVDSVRSIKSQSLNSSSADTKGTTDFLMENPDKSTRSSESKEILHLASNAEGENKRLSSTSTESMDSGSSYYDAKANTMATLSKEKVADERSIDSQSNQSERSGNQEFLESLHHKKSSQESSDGSFQDFASFTSSEASKLHLNSKVVKGNCKGHDQDSITLTSSRSATTQSKIDLESTCQPKKSLPISSQLALAPPLPKSPSESWLKRTLPTVSSRISRPKSTLATHSYATRQNTVF
ncbi:hypothetical protein IC582_026043 [Cucumis melo]